MLRCTPTLFDLIFTVVILYVLFILDMSLTFINMRNLKKLKPRGYLNYEKNVLIKIMIKKFGLKNGIIINSIIGIILFTLFVFYVPIQPALVVGILVALVFLIHLPNYFWIKKRLKKYDNKSK